MTDTTTAPAADATPVSTITIQGVAFEVDRPYKAGDHVLTEGEAHALNQTRAENLRNNFAPKVRSAFEEFRKANSLAEDAEVAATQIDADALQGEFDKYASDYKFAPGAGGGPRTPVDPIQREANRIATEKVKGALQTKNIKINSVSKDRMAELVAQVIAKYPAITEEATRRVKAGADISLDAVGL
jgi:hypothetical protein